MKYTLSPYIGLSKQFHEHLAGSIRAPPEPLVVPDSTVDSIGLEPPTELHLIGVIITIGWETENILNVLHGKFTRQTPGAVTTYFIDGHYFHIHLRLLYLTGGTSAW